ncbi:MAG: hypothetical protein V1781_06245 [Bacteroidota bacterium]
MNLRLVIDYILFIGLTQIRIVIATARRCSELAEEHEAGSNLHFYMKKIDCFGHSFYAMTSVRKS